MPVGAGRVRSDADGVAYRWYRSSREATALWLP